MASIHTSRKASPTAQALLNSAVHGLMFRKPRDPGVPGLTPVEGSLHAFGTKRNVRPSWGNVGGIVSTNDGPAWRGINSGAADTTPNRLDFTLGPWASWGFDGTTGGCTVVLRWRHRTGVLSTAATAFGVNDASNRINAHLFEGSLRAVWDVNGQTVGDGTRIVYDWDTSRFPVTAWNTMAFVYRRGLRAIWVNGHPVLQSVGAVGFNGAPTVWSWFGHPLFSTNYGTSDDLDYTFAGLWNVPLSDSSLRAITGDLDLFRSGADQRLLVASDIATRLRARDALRISTLLSGASATVRLGA